MVTHVMIDLETMGTQPGAPILAIGAVRFDPRGHGVDDQFLRTISLASCMAAGLKPDPKTIEWWMHQADNARLALFTNERVTLQAALSDFHGWLTGLDPDPKGLRIWCHGPGFDAAMLEHIYATSWMATPWRYSAPRCTRTLYELADVDVGLFRLEGTHHDALADCIAQVRAAQEAHRKLGLVPAACGVEEG